MTREELDRWILKESEARLENSILLRGDSREAASYYEKIGIDGLETRQEPLGIPVYMDGDTVLSAPYAHELVVGATGKGKTVFAITQSLLYMSLHRSQQPNLIYTDPKGELYDRLGERFRRAGYEVVVFNCKKPTDGLSYNMFSTIISAYHEMYLCRELLPRMRQLDSAECPLKCLRDARAAMPNRSGCALWKKLESCQTAEDAVNLLLWKQQECANMADKRINALMPMLIPMNDERNMSWQIGAQELVKGLLYWALEMNARCDTAMPDRAITPTLLTNLLHAKDEDGDFDSLVSMLRFINHPCSGPTIQNLVSRANQTKDSQLHSAIMPMAKWTGPAMASLVGGEHALDLTHLTDMVISPDATPVVTFLIPDADDPVTGILLNMMIHDLISSFTRAADEAPERRLIRPTLFVLDEFANLGGKIPDMTTYVTTTRSRNIFFQLYVQSYAQLNIGYGDADAAVIRENCDLLLFLGTNNFDTRAAIAKSFGRSPEIRISVSETAGGTSINRTAEPTDNVTVSDLELLHLGECYVQCSGRPHLKSFVKPYFMTDRWRTVGAASVPADESVPRVCQAPTFDLQQFVKEEREWYMKLPDEMSDRDRHTRYLAYLNSSAGKRAVQKNDNLPAGSDFRQILLGNADVIGMNTDDYAEWLLHLWKTLSPDAETKDVPTVVSGSPVVFGRMPYEDMENEPLAWTVLSTESFSVDHSVLLITQKVLKPIKFDTGSCPWSTSGLRRWLNTDFLAAAFNGEEFSRMLPILSPPVTNTRFPREQPVSPDDLIFHAAVSRPTLDFVTVSSADELIRYLNTGKKRAADVIRHVGDDDDDFFSGFRSERTGNGSYWTRSEGVGYDRQMVVTSTGQFCWEGVEKTDRDVGVRPVIRVRLTENEVGNRQSGDAASRLA